MSWYGLSHNILEADTDAQRWDAMTLLYRFMHEVQGKEQVGTFWTFQSNRAVPELLRKLRELARDIPDLGGPRVRFCLVAFSGKVHRVTGPVRA